MSDTTSNLPICIHCGTPRPADESLCPKCGKPWIDVQIAPPPEPTLPPVAPAAGAAVGAAAGASAAAPPPMDPPPPSEDPLHDTGEFGLDEWTLPPDPPKSKAIWIVPIVLLLAVGAFWAYVAFFGGSTAETTTTIAETTTTEANDTTTTSEPRDTTTTSEGSTTTLAAFPPASSWPAVGEPVDQADLTLQAAGIGPIEFGTTLSESAGTFVSSLGEAEAAGDDDMCGPEEAYWLQWGPLRAIYDGSEPDSLFVSYKYEDVGVGTSTVDLATLSGIKLGDTVQDLTDTYVSYTVTFEVIDSEDYFRLVDGGDLLLWGPVTSTDSDGTIIGIYSPSPCPAGQ